jgi:hypothetical protein
VNIILQNTTKIVEIHGVPCRIWEGSTAKGVRVIAFVTRLAVAADEDAFEFETELKDVPPMVPSPGAESFPSKLDLR